MYTPGYPPPYMQQQQPPQKQKKKMSIIPFALVLIAAAVVIGVVVNKNNIKKQEYQALVDEVASVEYVFLPNIYVDGVSVGGLSPQNAIDKVVAAVNERQNSWSVGITYQGHTFATLNYETLGITTDIAQVYSLLQEAYTYGHTGSLEDKKKDLDYFRENAHYVYTTQTNADTAHLMQNPIILTPMSVGDLYGLSP